MPKKKKCHFLAATIFHGVSANRLHGRYPVQKFPERGHCGQAFECVRISTCAAICGGRNSARVLTHRTWRQTNYAEPAGGLVEKHKVMPQETIFYKIV